MENLQNLTLLFKDIDKCCLDIVKKAVPVMKSIVDKKPEILEKLKDKFPQENDAKDHIEKISMQLIDDARTCRKELNGFVNALFLSEQNEAPESFGFLYPVWTGDTYGVGGVDGFKALLSDLQQQLQDCTIDNVLSKIYSK